MLLWPGGPVTTSAVNQRMETNVNEMKKNDGGPAFPIIVGYRTPNDSYAAVESTDGMSLHTYVATKVLQGLIAHEDAARSDARDQEAAQRVRASDVRTAFDYADAFMAEYERRSGLPPADNSQLVNAVRAALDANGHLRGCEAGAGTDGDEDNCTPHCVAIRKALP